MGRHVVRFVLLLLACSFAVSAQNPMERSPRRVRVDIQLYLPSGTKPSRPIAVQVRSEDWRVKQMLYTTSRGWVSIEAEEHAMLELLVPGEEGLFANTSLRFSPSEGRMAVHLNAHPGGAGTVSVAGLYQPDPKARELYEKAVKNLNKSRDTEAEDQLQQAAALDPRYTAPVVRLGRLRLSQHRFEEAEQLFRQALEVDTKSAAALAGLGIALSARGDYNAALEPLEEAARLSNGREVQFHLGVALMENGRWQEAERALQPVADSDSPLAASSHFALGRLYEQRGDARRGISSFESFLLLRPRGPAAEVARDSIRALRLLPLNPQ